MEIRSIIYLDELVAVLLETSGDERFRYSKIVLELFEAIVEHCSVRLPKYARVLQQVLDNLKASHPAHLVTLQLASLNVSKIQ